MQSAAADAGMQIWGDCFCTLLCVLRLHSLSQERALYHKGAQASCDSRNALGSDIVHKLFSRVISMGRSWMAVIEPAIQHSLPLTHEEWDSNCAGVEIGRVLINQSSYQVALFAAEDHCPLKL